MSKAVDVVVVDFNAALWPEKHGKSILIWVLKIKLWLF